MKASDERDQAFNEGIERAIEAGPRRRNRAKNLKDAQNEAAQWHERFAREKQTEDDRIDAVVEQGEAGLERIGHGAKFRRGQRGFAAQKRQEAAATRAAKHAMQQEHQGWEQHNADVERESGRAADAMVDMAQAHGESREVVANLRRIAEVAKQEAADTRRMFSRMMKAEEETAFGGGPH